MKRRPGGGREQDTIARESTGNGRAGDVGALAEVPGRLSTANVHVHQSPKGELKLSKFHIKLTRVLLQPEKLVPPKPSEVPSFIE